MMKIAAAITACVAASACSDPPLRIIYEIQEGDTGQGCSTSNCGEITMTCDAVLHLRILNPADPDLPYVSICQEVQPNKDMDLCAIGRIDLPVTEVPRETLEVQVTVWRKEFVLVPGTDTLDCLRTPVQFDAIYGFPITATPSEGPAFGGRAFYHPGDSETVVTLGCTNQASINAASCTGTNNLAVTASVIDFDTIPISVSPQTGSTLTVAIGQPASSDGVDYVLNSGDADVLMRTTISPPAWGGDVGVTIDSSACVQVTEDAPQTTSTLHCQPATVDDHELDLLGIRVPAASLDEILVAGGFTEFPGAGLTLGIVLDESDNPAAGVTISVDPGSTIEILNAMGTAIVPGNTTTASGMFISRDAPYGTFFGATKITPFPPQLGGRVKNKLTIVLFQQSGIGN